MSAKVDTTAIQAGYPLYHHVTIADRDGRWIVIQQGINTTDSTARRYHWCGDHVASFITEPHNGIVGHQVPHAVLNMTAQQSVPSQQIAVDLVNDHPRHLQRDFATLRVQPQATLHHWLETPSLIERFAAHRLAMPKRINWTAVKRVYEFQPRNYEELLAQPGIGPATVRGLALVSELIYGAAPSWHDPIKYTFAYGGKDGVPFPVDRPAMDESIHFLRDAITQVNGDNRTKLRALQRLRSLAPETLRQPIGLMG
jgi:hypothetical protein